ncbi:MAG: ATP-binding protein, partial [Elusimicrobiales bacterium]|nr:ATP-binding protein [Elusimicrobiales bacterium]
MDEERIRQVLINLVSNALKYTPEEGRVTISAKIVSDDFVEISVRDTGVGITQEYLKTIFDKFSQGKNKWISPAAGKGTGLGLYIAKTIIEAHNGFMYAESEEEKGSRFAFKLPLA